MQELLQQFPPGSSEAKGEPVAACALPTGAISSPCTHLSLQQTPAVRCGDTGTFQSPCPALCPCHSSAFAPQPCPAWPGPQSGEWSLTRGTLPTVPNPAAPKQGLGHQLHTTTTSHSGMGRVKMYLHAESQAPDVVTAAPGPARRDAPAETSSNQPSQRQCHQSCLPAGEQRAEPGTLCHTSTSLCPSQGCTHCAGIGGSSAKPQQHKQLQIKRGRQSWHRAPTLPSPVCHNQVNVLACAQTQRAPPALRDTPLPASPPSPVPQSHSLLSLLASGPEPSTECQGWGEGLCRGFREPERFRASPGRWWQRAAPCCPSPGALGAGTAMLRRVTLGRKPHLSLFCLSIRVRSLTLSMTKIKLHFSQPEQRQRRGIPQPGVSAIAPRTNPEGPRPCLDPTAPGLYGNFLSGKNPTFFPLDPAQRSSPGIPPLLENQSASRGCAANSRGYI